MTTHHAYSESSVREEVNGPYRYTNPIRYTLVSYGGGRYWCNCPGFEAARRRGGECKHIEFQRVIDRVNPRYREREPMTNLPAVKERDTAVTTAPRELQPTPVGAGEMLPTPAQFEMMSKIASTVLEAGAGMVPTNIKTPQAALAVMLAGHELGFTPFASLRQVFIVNGRTELMTQGLIALVMQRDPTAYFKWHRYDSQGADVELFRNGVSIIRCAYGADDVAQSHQGYKKKGQWKTAQSGRQYFQAERDANGKVIYERDEESPWFEYPRDMYAYNAVKRCCRLGAPDLLLLAPRFDVDARPGADYHLVEAVDPTAPLHKAIMRGEVDPGRVVGDAPDDDEAPTERPDTEPDEEEPPAPDVTVTTETETTTEVETPEADDEQPATEEQRNSIVNALADMKQTWGTDYAPFFRELITTFWPKAAGSGSNLNELLATLNRREARQVRYFIAGRRGEPEA